MVPKSGTPVQAQGPNGDDRLAGGGLAAHVDDNMGQTRVRSVTAHHTHTATHNSHTHTSTCLSNGTVSLAVRSSREKASDEQIGQTYERTQSHGPRVTRDLTHWHNARRAYHAVVFAAVGDLNMLQQLFDRGVVTGVNMFLCAEPTAGVRPSRLRKMAGRTPHTLHTGHWYPRPTASSILERNVSAPSTSFVRTCTPRSHASRTNRQRGAACPHATAPCGTSQ